MAKDFRKIESFLADFFRGYGASPTSIDGHLYVGAVEVAEGAMNVIVHLPTDDDEDEPVINLTKLAQEIAEFE